MYMHIYISIYISRTLRSVRRLFAGRRLREGGASDAQRGEASGDQVGRPTGRSSEIRNLSTSTEIGRKQRPTRPWHRGKGVLERNQSSQNRAEQRKARALICRGVLRTHCPSFAALRGFPEGIQTSADPGRSTRLALSLSLSLSLSMIYIYIYVCIYIYIYLQLYIV